MRYDSSILQICTLHESIESLSVGFAFQFVILAIPDANTCKSFPAKLDAAVNEL